MKIVYFYQYFSTPGGAWGTRVYEFAKHWSEKGHDVTVVTSVYYKSDIQTKKFIETKYINGVKVIILNVLISNKQSFIKRIWSFILYSILSSYFALTLNADIVIASSGPITVGIPGLIARHIRRRRLVFEVRDLWPEGVIQMGILKNQIAKKLAYGLEKWCYRVASLIVTLSPGMSDWIRKTYGYQHTISVPNLSDNELFGQKYNTDGIIPDDIIKKNIALYTGNIGEVNNSFLLMKAAQLLQSKQEDSIVIVLIGDGQLRERLQREANDNGLTNFYIFDSISKDRLAVWVQHAMCSIVPLMGTKILDTSSPNKLFDSFAAGTPVIQTTQGWIKELIDKEQCGFTVSPERPTDLVDKLLLLSRNPDLREMMGNNARKVALTEFDKNQLASRMLDGLLNVYNDYG
jgi:glycosyltransferase involved in cell wall biosynthesis